VGREGFDPDRLDVEGHLLVDALRQGVRGGREFGARAVVVDAITAEAATFYRHFGFHGLDDRRLWRRLADIERALASEGARVSSRVVGGRVSAATRPTCASARGRGLRETWNRGCLDQRPGE
jgi:hypothetical protein